MAHTAKDQVLCEELSVSGLKKIVEIAKKNILIITFEGECRYPVFFIIHPALGSYLQLESP